MNVKEVIKNNINCLSPKEKQVATFLINNLNNFDELGIKNISKKLNIQEGVISKTLAKVGLEGFKNFKSLVKESFYFQHEKEAKILSDFNLRLHEDLDKTFKSINSSAMNKIVELIVKQKPKIILFATGKTKIIVENFYFSLIELGYHVEIYSSLYAVKAFSVDQKVIFVFSISGKNHKVYRYLNSIHSQKSLKIIGISGSEYFFGKELVTDHFYGKVSSFFADNSRAFPFIEKYPLLLILDLFLFHFLIKTEDFKLNQIVTKNTI